MCGSSELRSEVMRSACGLASKGSSGCSLSAYAGQLPTRHWRQSYTSAFAGIKLKGMLVSYSE